jgi:hypothetical protein
MKYNIIITNVNDAPILNFLNALVHAIMSLSCASNDTSFTVTHLVKKLYALAEQ